MIVIKPRQHISLTKFVYLPAWFLLAARSGENSFNFLEVMNMSNINSTSSLRVQGTVNSMAEFAKSRPGMVRQATEAQINEGKAWEEQMRLREEAVNRYAAAHPDKVYGQVIVDGKLFATVYDSGSAGTPYAIPGLSENGTGIELAERRLAEIARAVKGKITYSDFLPPVGGPGCSIPDEVAATFPKVTARPFGGHPEMTPALEQEMQQAFERSRMTHAADVAQKAG